MPSASTVPVNVIAEESAYPVARPFFCFLGTAKSAWAGYIPTIKHTVRGNFITI